MAIDKTNANATYVAAMVQLEKSLDTCCKRYKRQTGASQNRILSLLFEYGLKRLLATERLYLMTVADCKIREALTCSPSVVPRKKK